MCRNCMNNFTTQAGLAWSLPVHPAKLGAHLSAYRDARPTVMQLLLCHSKGRGEGVNINRLPRELIDLIIEHYMRPLRAQKFKEWDLDFGCFEGRCTFRDHFTKSQWFGYLSEAWEEGVNPLITDETQDQYAQEVAEDSGDAWETHQERLEEWEHKLCQKSPTYTSGHALSGTSAGGSGPFAVLDEILGKDFGLGVFLSHQRLPCWLEEILDLPPQVLSIKHVHNTTLAFLTLPTQFLFDDGTGLACGAPDDSSYESMESMASHMSAAVDIKSLLKSERQTKRFQQALKVLDLRPYIHPVQLLPFKEQEHRGRNELKMSKAWGKDIVKHGNEKGKAMLENNVKKMEKAKWPQLLHLVSTSHSFAL